MAKDEARAAEAAISLNADDMFDFHYARMPGLLSFSKRILASYSDRPGGNLPLANMNMVEAIDLALMEEMARDESIIVLGEDVGQLGGVFRVTDGLQAKFGPERVMDTPLAESAIVGTSLGLAVGGFKPVPEIEFMGFVPPALDQFICHISRYRNRSRGRFTLPMVVRMPYGAGIEPRNTIPRGPEAILAHIPGIKVVIPSNPFDAKGLLTSALGIQTRLFFLSPREFTGQYAGGSPGGRIYGAIGNGKGCSSWENGNRGGLGLHGQGSDTGG